MATRLKNVAVGEVSLVKKGANGKRIFLTKSHTQEETDEMDNEQIEKAQKEAADAKAALEKAATEKAEVEAKLAALEKAQAEAAEAAAAEKAELEKAAADAAAAKAELEKALATEKEAKEVAESIQKAAVDFKNLPEKAEDIGPMLRAIRKSDAATADKLEALLKKLDALAKDALNPKGVATGQDTSASALEEMTKRAQALVAEKKVASLAKGFDEVLRQDPALYARYTAEKSAR